MRLYDQPAWTVAMYSHVLTHLDNMIFWACSARNFEQQWSASSLLSAVWWSSWVELSGFLPHRHSWHREGWNKISTLLQLFSNDIKVAPRLVRWANGIARGCLLPVFHFLTITARVAQPQWLLPRWQGRACGQCWPWQGPERQRQGKVPKATTMMIFFLFFVRN